jgi:hypothetical protein
VRVERIKYKDGREDKVINHIKNERKITKKSKERSIDNRPVKSNQTKRRHHTKTTKRKSESNKKVSKGKAIYWEDSWHSIEEELKNQNLEKFRNNTGIVQRLSGGPKSIAGWVNLCNNNKIDPKYFSDSLLCHPKDVVKKGGVSVTKCSMRHAYYAHRILEKIEFTQPIVVLEVGGGYGGFIEQLARRVSIKKCYLIDSPPMQQIQKYYLTKAGYEYIIEFPELYEYPPELVDLIVTTNTLAEMEYKNVKKYIDIFEQILKPETGLLYSVQRREAKGPHLHTAWDDYPFDKSWELEVCDFTGNVNFAECFGRRKE